jgi:hypothetical protein
MDSGYRGVMPEGRINNMTGLLETKILRLFGLTIVHYLCPYAQMSLSVSLCRAASELRPSGMTYNPLFYIVRLNIFDYANMLICPSGVTYNPLFYIVRLNIFDYANMLICPSGMTYIPLFYIVE